MPNRFEFLRRKLHLIVLAGGLSLALALAALLAFGGFESWDRAQRDAERSVANLSLVAEQEVASTLRTIDVSLKTVAELIELSPARQLDAPAVGVAMKGRLKDLPFVRSISIFDADGHTVQNTTGTPVAPAITAADRDYFAVHRDDPARGLVLGTPITGRTTQQLTVPMSRRIDGLDGKFAGAVVAFVDPRAIAEVYSNVDVGAGGAIAMIRTDGTMLARFPYREDFIGRSLRDTPLFREHLPRSRVGIIARARIDGVERLYGYRMLADFPVVMFVGIEQDRILREGLPSLLVDFGVAAAFVIIIGLATMLLTRALRQQQALLIELSDSEQHARKSETEFRALFNDLPVGISDSTVDGRILAVNMAWRQMYGFGETDALTGINVSELWADPSGRDRWLKQLTQHGFVGRAEMLRRRRDGTEFWAELHVRGVADAGSRLQKLRSIHLDITERKRSGEAKARLGWIIENTSNEIYVFDAKTLQFSDVNHRAREALGYSLDELVAMTPLDIKPEYTRESFEKLIAPLRNNELPKVDFKTRHRRKDGSIYDVAVSLHLSRFDDSQVFVAIIEDISHIKKVEAARRQTEQFLRAILDHTGEAVIAIDERGSVTEFNRMAGTIFGYAAVEVLGKNINMLMPDPERTGHDGYIKSYLETGVAKVIGIGREVRGCRKDGTVFPVGLTVAETAVGGKRGFVGTLRDLTQTKRLQEQLLQSQKMEAVGQLTGGIAHDFNNLLTVVLGNAEILTEALAGDPNLKRVADMVGMAAQRAADLTRSLLAFSRNQPLEPKVTDINQLVTRMDGMMRRTLGEQVEIKLVRDGALWPATVDPAQLEAAILNLALNARDAMPAGGKLIIETANAELDRHYARQQLDVEPGSYVTIAVSDSGAGMTPEVAARAFDPFFTTKEVGKGTGLGLSMVYGFAKQSNGSVKLYSEAGHGTTVKLYLPRSSESDKQAVAAGDAAPARGGNETILMVEDDLMVRVHVESQVKSLGYRVLSARDGAQALEILRQDQKIDLLFTDVVMPGGINGPQLAAEARRLRPALKVLYTSGYSENVIQRQGMLDRGDELLDKPYTRQHLAAKLRAVLDGKPPAP